MGFLNRLFQNGKVITKATGEAATNLSEKGGGFLGRVAGKIFNTGAGIVSKGKDYITDPNTIEKMKDTAIRAKDMGIRTGRSIASGAVGLADDAVQTGSFIGSQFLGEAPISTYYFGADSRITKAAKHMALLRRDPESIFLGVKATKKGAALILGGSLIAGVPQAGRDFMSSRTGYNDGQLYTNAPINSYATMGNSYAHNAGATGDLVFALHNQRHTGLF